jgi:branched-chain amino acid transport system substrate-binding protein
MIRHSWAYALSLICAFSLVSCAGEGGDTGEIVIGEYGSLTGATATFGISTKNGIDMAIAEVNAGGGVLGRPVRVIVEDDQGRPEEAQTVVTKLITSDRVVAVLGEVASSNSLAAAPVAQQNQIPMISPSSTNPAVTQIGDYIFRVCWIDPFQGLVMATFAKNTLGLNQVAILRDVKSDYSVGLADVFAAEFAKMGGTIVADESYSAGDTDFNAQLTSIRGRNPQGIFIPGYYTDVGLIARQARSGGYTGALMGGDGWDSQALLNIGGDALANTYYSNHFSVDDQAPAVQKFVTDYQTKYGQKPDALAGLGYDAAMLLFDAMRRANSTDGPAVRDALAATTNFAGVTGTITLDANRNAVKPAVVLKYENGGYAYVETITPP